jgi:predicted RND superfamily exporter protein
MASFNVSMGNNSSTKFPKRHHYNTLYHSFTKTSEAVQMFAVVKVEVWDIFQIKLQSKMKEY